jgi:DNA-binding MarR family transcriptional regulator
MSGVKQYRQEVCAVGVEGAVLRALRQIIHEVDLYSRRLASSFQLTGPQLACLLELMRSGPVSSGVLAAALYLTPATVTGILDRMEARGLVTRHREPPDKRKVTVALTRLGREMVNAAPEPLQDSFVRQFRRMPAAQQQEMLVTLQRVVTMMSAHDADAAQSALPGPSDVTASPDSARS